MPQVNLPDVPADFGDEFTIELNSEAQPSDFIRSTARLLGRPDIVEERLESTQM